MTQGTSQNIATFRDPAGSLRIHGEQVLRTIHPHYAAESLRFLQSDLARRWTEQGHLVASQVVSAEADQPLLLEHPRVFFPSYPWEWTPGQWVAAGELTLELCGQLLREGWIRPDSEFSGFKAQLARVPTSQLPDDKRYNPLALNPYVLYRALPQARRYTLAELVAAMEHLLRCNLQLVSSGLDRPLILQQTLVRIVEKRDVSASAAAAR